MRESDIENYLVERAQALGGEVRKVRWIGRAGAPDRLVMLPRSLDPRKPWHAPIWVEVKAPGKAATFPSNARERAQQREHERMRKMGQRVVVVDSFEMVDEVLS